jgi:hypothetical protein
MRHQSRCVTNPPFPQRGKRPRPPLSSPAAVSTAVGLVTQGMEGVTITDKSGRVFQAAEFAEFFRTGSESID